MNAQSMKKQTIEMMGKQIQVEITKKAAQQLSNRLHPLFIEMELYFSCLLRKEIRIRESARGQIDEAFTAQLSDNLHISFRPVMTKACSVSSCEGEAPPLSDFPIKKPQSYVPKWLKLDFKKGEWCGDFGY
ncbi:hypothetical protein MNBD_GAMMA05-2063 [hydrothermal vent metagenome]|uniref:Uncharacterized protein n=1 Tax=hydrothermal vent metagenome TaxID=652676 RepID=A0A3B0WG25_9ZZZZ